MMKSKRILFIIGLFLMTFATALLGSQDGYARSSDVDLITKAQMYGAAQCYDGGFVEESVKLGESQSGGQALWFGDVVVNRGQVYLPYNISNIKDNNIDCFSLFFGYGKPGTKGYEWFGEKGTIIGVEATADSDGTDVLVNPDAISELLNAMGYTLDKNSVSNNDYGNCLQVSFKSAQKDLFHKYNSSNSVRDETVNLCFVFNKNQAYNEARVQPAYAQYVLAFISEGANSQSLGVIGGGVVSTVTGVSVNLKEYKNITEVKDAIENAIGALSVGDDAAFVLGDNEEVCKAEILEGYLIRSCVFDLKIEFANAEKVEKVSYMRASTVNNFLDAIFGSHDTDFEDFELYDLYVNYYLRASGYEAEIVCLEEEGSTQTGNAEGSGYERVTLYDNGVMNQNCYARTDKKPISNLYIAEGIKNTQRHLVGGSTSFSQLIAAINELSSISSMANILSAAGVPGIESDPNISTEFKDLDNADNDKNSGYYDDDNGGNNGGNNGESVVDCSSSGAMESLGWIICPVLSVLQKSSQRLYDGYVEPALQVEPTLFTGTNSGTEQGWNTFRDIANVLLIIFFLFVIFSQLTGYGIDNYGIKKILPKIIVAAILMNLSYYICVALIDLSNILGNALQAMFSGLPTGNIPSEVTAQMSEEGAGGLISAGILAVLVVGVVAVWENPAIVFTLLVSALGVMASIFFLFVLLAAREAAIVVLTILSPLAVACFMLPNTKNLFDKWWKFFYSLLMVYPICGVLVGGGNYVSRLLLSNVQNMNGDFFYSFMAMIVGIVPIFFIPTVLKGSLNMIGQLGAKISGMGKTVGGGLQRGARNTGIYKGAQQVGQERRARIRAGVDKNGNDRKLFGRLNVGKARRAVATTGVGRFVGLDRALNRNAQAAGKIRSEGVEAAAALANQAAATEIANEKYGGDAEAYYKDQFNKAADRGDTDAMEAAILAAETSGRMKSKDVAKMVRNRINSEKGIKFRNQAAGSAWMSGMAARHRNTFSTDFELNDYMQRGGMSKGKALKLGNYGDYIRNSLASGDMERSDIRPEDFGTLSGDSIAGILRSGIADSSMLRRAIEANRNLSTDKRIMLEAAANGVDYSGYNVEGIKNEATNLMNTDWTTAQTVTMGGGAGGASIDVDRATYDRWTAPKPQDVRVVNDTSQGPRGGGSGDQDDDWLEEMFAGRDDWDV